MKLLICISVFAVLAVCFGQDETTIAPEPTPSDDFKCPDRNESFHADPKDCAAYYHCTNGLAWHLRCAGELYFNPKTNLCDYPFNVDCNAPTEDPELRGVSMIDPNPDYECDPENNGAFPHDEFCEQYYDCYEGVATHFTCTDIMLFDLNYDGCNYAQDVNCGNRTRPGGYPSEKPKPTTVTAATERPPFDCPEIEGLFEDPLDCSGYWQCYGGNAWHQYCSPKLYFSFKSQVCDYLASVDCGDRPIDPPRNATLINVVKNGNTYEVED